MAAPFAVHRRLAPLRTHLRRPVAEIGPYLKLMSVVLFGYAVLGKPFAYIPVGPVYIGDAALFVGVCSLLGDSRAARAALTPALIPVYVLLALCALHLAFEVPIYGVDAIRDAAVCVYALAAVVTFAFLRQRAEALRRLVSLYRVVVIAAPTVIGVVWLLTTATGMFEFRVAGAVNPVLKGGDIMAHAAGMLAFVTLGMGQLRAPWLLGPCLIACLGVNNRGGMLAFGAGALICAVISRRRLLIAVVASVLGLILLTAFTTGIDLSAPGSTRSFSADIVARSLRSIAQAGDDPNLQGTARWRLDWWRRIVDYTFTRDYFWTGRGFGPNLADEDGFSVADNHALRSPHNIHLTYLARLGVPGGFAWLCVLAAWFAKVLAAMRQSRRARDEGTFRTLSFCLVYLLSVLITSSFDVAIEGPVMGLWFWTIYGAGLAAAMHRSARQVNTPIPARLYDRPHRTHSPVLAQRRGV
jgi:hypothetical protein